MVEYDLNVLPQGKWKIDPFLKLANWVNMRFYVGTSLTYILPAVGSEAVIL